MAPISNAEKCRRYREKHRDEYRKADALRKKHKIAMMKVKDPKANEFRLKLQREKKREYRKKVNEAKENQTPPSSAESSFSNKSVKCRSLKKSVDALPKSPNKRHEIVQSLSQKFNLRIKLTSNKKQGRPENELSPEETEWLIEFMDRPDITYTNPGKKDQRYVGKENGKSKFVPIRYLLWTIRDLLDIINGCSGMVQNETDDFSTIFDKNLTFRQLYKFLKEHKEFVFNKDIPQASCLCEICENLIFLVRALSSKINKPILSNIHSLVESYSCNSSSKACMYSDCEVCYDTGLGVEDFTDDCTEIQFYQWKRVDKKVQKVESVLPPDEFLSLFNEEVKVLKKHIYIKRQQHATYNQLKENLKTGEILLHVDYSENYVNKQQGEIQSAYFGHDSFSIFTACCYLRDAEEKLVNENVVVVSEASDHSRIAAFTCINKVFNFVREKHELPLKVTLHVWSDGCAGQFRSRYVFSLLSTLDKTVNLRWYYNERHHGKGPMDGVGGTIKNRVYRDVMSNKCLIKSAEEFSNHANKVVNGITSLYLPESDLLAEPDNIEEAPKIPETLSVHMLVRNFNEDSVCSINFFNLATDVEPFFTQFYIKDGDPEVCGHEMLPLSFDPDQTCAFCKGRYEGKVEWLQCNICEQWFHQHCFHK